MVEGERREPPCTAPEHRQFDFWLGEWEVHDAQGELVGRNRITPVLDGCALREEWRGESGLRGMSLTAWSAARGRWHQTWVDSAGTVLLLEGGLRDDAMVLEGDAALPGHPERMLRQRITWALIEGDAGRLRQHWQVRGDGDGWETAFDGRYHRVTRP